MHFDLLVAEIGSTTTVVNAFTGIHSGHPQFAGQGQAPTTVLQGDVTMGLKAAVADLAKRLQGPVTWDEMLASSSAAGGLKMSVHGLVLEMTVKAAREAALGAGGIVRYVTAGKLTPYDLREVAKIRPNIILLAGGVDFGERETALFNARALTELPIRPPIIYAGNTAIRGEIRQILEEAGFSVTVVENVYPRIDELNIEPTRRMIQKVFEEHIVHAPGMERVREMVKGPIIPTPGAVMNAAKLLAEELGDLMVLDVGGATTDVHSVTEGSPEIAKLLTAPEPKAKRTVEGDLGVYVNARSIIELIGREQLTAEFGPAATDLIANLHPIPQTEQEIRLVERLTLEAVRTAVTRHAGALKFLYGPTGRIVTAEGKDLSAVRYIIGTGGALTRLPRRVEIMAELVKGGRGRELFPKADAQILVDHHYIMASLGVMAEKYPTAAIELLKDSLKI